MNIRRLGQSNEVNYNPLFGFEQDVFILKRSVVIICMVVW